eukprot:2957570-Rhodomonas_salina.2
MANSINGYNRLEAEAQARHPAAKVLLLAYLRVYLRVSPCHLRVSPALSAGAGHAPRGPDLSDVLIPKTSRTWATCY